MKARVTLAAGLLACLALAAGAVDFSAFGDDLPSISYNESAFGQPLASPVGGKLLASQTDGVTTAIALACENPYFYQGEERVSRHEIWILGIEGYTAPAVVKPGTALGTIGPRTRIVAVAPAIDEFMIRSTNSMPGRRLGHWFVSPWWIVPTATVYLSFRQVDSFEAAVQDFYGRWFAEEPEGKEVGSTIHYYPNLDRIRVKLKLDAYPVPTRRTAALNLTEMSYYRPGLFVSENSLVIDCPYQPVIYWQNGFTDYLRKEYELGTELYVYCSIYSLDHAEKKIVVCARDFALVSDEDVIAQRMTGLPAD